jgi:hypothetical protein
MDVIDLQRQAKEAKDRLVFNPLKRDFTWKYDGEPYTIASLDSKKFPSHIAELLGKHIIDEYLSGEKFISDDKRKKATELVYGEK